MKTLSKATGVIMNNSKAIALKANYHCIKLANERFGLEMLAEALLSDLNCCDNTRSEIIKLAKKREFKKVSSMIEDVKNSDACFVTILTPTSAMTEASK